MSSTAIISNPSALILGLTAALTISVTYNLFAYWNHKKQSQHHLNNHLNPNDNQAIIPKNEKKDYSPSIAQIHSISPTNSENSLSSKSNSSSSNINKSESESKSITPIFELTNKTKCKMILVVRNDLQMGKGKIAAQCCHAACGVVQDLIEMGQNKLINTWTNNGAMKIAVKVNSEEELEQLEIQAIEAGLPNYLVIDAGHTQVSPNTKTVLAIGPAPIANIDKVCSQLKLM